MLSQLDAIEKRFEEVTSLMGQPEVVQDMSAYTELTKEYKALERVVEVYKAYKEVVGALQEAKGFVLSTDDQEFKGLAKEEVATLTAQQEELTGQLKRLLLPSDPKDSKNSILELRAGTGGNEAALWVGDLFRMYQRFAEQQGWRLQVIDFTEGSSGGYKEVIAMVSGEQVYGMLKYESGIHRVQRVPATESQGRLHTSAASVAVLPEMDKLDIQLDMGKLRKDTFCSSGPGGQSVNTTYSAIRLTYTDPALEKPIVVSCQDEKSQIKNYEKALKVLHARVYEQLVQAQRQEVDTARRLMVKSGDRSDKIRTYNYPQDRMTDHRIQLTQHNLTGILGGDLKGVIEALRMADHADKLQGEAP